LTAAAAAEAELLWRQYFATFALFLMRDEKPI
jgi:hypothetical protein